MSKHPALTMQQREQNQAILDRMNTMVNYIKNPRYKTTHPDFRVDSTVKPQSSKGPFRVEPSFILFTDYVVDKVYELKFSVVNVSSCISRIKIIPPILPQFSIGTPRYPDPNSGDIAPGLQVQVAVHFKPSSLEPFRDKVTICTQSELLQLQLLAKREQPSIEVSLGGQKKQIFQFQQVWVGFQTSLKLEVLNKGGQSTFRILSPQAARVHLPLRHFQLGKQERVTVDCIFGPEEAREYEQVHWIASEQGNKWELKFRGKANTLEVSIKSICGIEFLKQDKIQTIFIDSALPNSKVMRTIVLKNMALVPFEFLWALSPPHSDFWVQPASGQFLSGVQTEFQIWHQCRSLQPCQCQASFSIKNLPQSCISNKNKVKKGDLVEIFNFPVKTIPQHATVEIEFPKRVFSDVPLFRPYLFQVKLINKDPLPLEYKVKYISNQGFVCLNPVGLLSQFTQHSLRFSCTPMTKQNCSMQIMIYFNFASPLKFIAECIVQKPSVSLNQGVLDFGLIEVGESKSKVLTVINERNFQTEIQLEFLQGQFYQKQQSQDYYLYLEQQHTRLQTLRRRMTLPPRGAAEFRVRYFSRRLQQLRLKAKIDIKNGSPVYFQIWSSVQSIDVELSDIQLAFEGFVDISCKPKILQIINKTCIATNFEWAESSQSDVLVKFTPEKGELPAKGKVSCQLQLRPLKKGSHKLFLECKINRSDSLFVQTDLNIRGVQLKLYLRSQQLKTKRSVISESTMKGMSKLSKSKRSRGSKQMLSFSDQEEVQYDYPELTKLQLFNCRINEPKQVSISIKNLSGIDTFFSVKSLNYNVLHRIESQAVESEQLAQMTSLGKSSHKVLTSKNSKLALKETKVIPKLFKTPQFTFTSEQGKMANRKHGLQRQQVQCLKDSKGLAFICNPSSNKLKKNSQQIINITLFNSICGQFQDSLIFQVQDHQNLVIPVSIDIDGSPLSISRSQVGINFNESIPVLNIGKYMKGSGSITKQFRVSNNGSQALNIQWKIYDRLNSKSQKNLFQLSLQRARPGSQDLVHLKWNPIPPQEQENSLFKVSPAKAQIQPHSQFTFAITFDTVNLGFFNSMLVAIPSVSNNPNSLFKAVSLDIRADTESAHLSIDKRRDIQAEHIFKFEKLAIGTTPKSRKQITLRNQSASTLEFSISTEGPFQIKRTSSNSSKASIAGLKNSLRPATNFALVPNSILQIDLQFLGLDPDDLKLWPLAQQIALDGLLKIHFTNQQSQSINLRGYLFRPVLQLLTAGQKDGDLFSEIDFGLVNTKNKKIATLVLSNPSAVQCRWKISHLTKTIPLHTVILTKLQRQDMEMSDQPSYFLFQKQEGVIPPTSLLVHPIPETLALPSPQWTPELVPIRLKVSFSPLKRGIFRSRYSLQVQRGVTLRLTLTGRGTYNEQQEK